MAIFGESRRYPVDIARVPARVKQAFIAIEDNRFYQHHGVDYKGVARALWLLATTDDKRVPGGSTITQQVARQFFLSRSEEHTSELQSLMRISYAVFCLKQKTNKHRHTLTITPEQENQHILT